MKTAEKFVGFDVLKRSVSMAQILDRYGLLDRLHRSGDSLSGACPIHAGHNPMQFRVSLSKNCWICFGDCHTGGRNRSVTQRTREHQADASPLLQTDTPPEAMMPLAMNTEQWL